MQAITPIHRRPLHEQAVDRLRELIIRGVLVPGERLNERLLCQQFAISHTPLREAIKLLASEGLVALLPNRGAQVAPLEAGRLAETLDVTGAQRRRRSRKLPRSTRPWRRNMRAATSPAISATIRRFV
jgi:DNA-binding GntR family transcriptional regulator